MKKHICILLLLACLDSCKKEETTLHSGTITWYHEVNGKIVSEVYLPSAFSPGHDGINDVYSPKWRGCAAKAYRLDIFNAYNKKIFTTNVPYIGWNGMYSGTRVPSGRYYYTVTLDDTTGYVYQIRYGFELLR